MIRILLCENGKFNLSIKLFDILSNQLLAGIFTLDSTFRFKFSEKTRRFTEIHQRDFFSG